MPNKLNHLQKRYAQKYIEEGGEQYQSMVDRVLMAAQQHLQTHPEYGSLSSIANFAHIPKQGPTWHR